MANKAHQPTATSRRQVAIAAAAGMPHSDISLALGICRNTLLRYYSNEIEQGAFRKRMDVITALFQSAMRGNATAAKVILSGTPQFARPATPVKAPKLGKKAQAQIDAKTAAAGTSWDELLDPKKVN